MHLPVTGISRANVGHTIGDRSSNTAVVLVAQDSNSVTFRACLLLSKEANTSDLESELRRDLHSWLLGKLQVITGRVCATNVFIGRKMSVMTQTRFLWALYERQQLLQRVTVQRRCARACVCVCSWRYTCT